MHAGRNYAFKLYSDFKNFLPGVPLPAPWFFRIAQVNLVNFGLVW